MTVRIDAKIAGKQRPKMRPPFKVRHEPPTLEEAIYAAQGVTTDIEQQIELAADLMNMPAVEIRPHALKAAARPPTSSAVTTTRNRLARRMGPPST